jgi:hypothetical protein
MCPTFVTSPSIGEFLDSIYVIYVQVNTQCYILDEDVSNFWLNLREKNGQFPDEPVK